MSDTMSDAAGFHAPEQAEPDVAGEEPRGPDHSTAGHIPSSGARRSPTTGNPPGRITATPPQPPRASATVRRVLALQQTVGNRAVTQLLRLAPHADTADTKKAERDTAVEAKAEKAYDSYAADPEVPVTSSGEDKIAWGRARREFMIDGAVFHVRPGSEAKDLHFVFGVLQKQIHVSKGEQKKWREQTGWGSRMFSEALSWKAYPDIEMWDKPAETIKAAEDGFEHTHDAEAACDLLAQAVKEYDRCCDEWHSYLGDTAKGAGQMATGLEFTEDAAIAVETTLLTDGLGDFAAETVGLGEEAVTGAGVAARTGEEVEGAAGAAVRATRAKAFAMTAGRAGVKAGTAGVVTMTETAAEELYKPPPKGFSWSKVLEEGAEKAAATFIGGLNEGWITSLLQKRFKILSRQLIPEGEFDKLYVESKKLLEAQGVELTRKMFMSKARKVFTNAIERLPTNLLESILEEAAKKVFGEGEAEHGDAQTDHDGREPSDASEPSEAKKPSEGAKKSSSATKEENERFGVEALGRLAHEVAHGFKEALEDALTEDSAVLLKDTFVSE